MLKIIHKNTNQIYKLFALILYKLGIFSVNSSCNLMFFQEDEPQSLKRFKKNDFIK